MGNCVRECNNLNLPLNPGQWKINPDHLVELIELIQNGDISAKIAADIFPVIFAEGESPRRHVESKGLRQISDSGELEKTVNKVLEANPDEVAAYKAGKKKLISFFVGQIMKVTKGKANPALANKLLANKLGK